MLCCTALCCAVNSHPGHAAGSRAQAGPEEAPRGAERPGAPPVPGGRSRSPAGSARSSAPPGPAACKNNTTEEARGKGDERRKRGGERAVELPFWGSMWHCQSLPGYISDYWELWGERECGEVGKERMKPFCVLQTALWEKVDGQQSPFFNGSANQRVTNHIFLFTSADPDMKLPPQMNHPTAMLKWQEGKLNDLNLSGKKMCAYATSLITIVLRCVLIFSKPICMEYLRGRTRQVAALELWKKQLALLLRFLRGQKKSVKMKGWQSLHHYIAQCGWEAWCDDDGYEL